MFHKLNSKLLPSFIPSLPKIFLDQLLPSQPLPSCPEYFPAFPPTSSAFPPTVSSFLLGSASLCLPHPSCYFLFPSSVGHHGVQGHFSPLRQSTVIYHSVSCAALPPFPTGLPLQMCTRICTIANMYSQSQEAGVKPSSGNCQLQWDSPLRIQSSLGVG